MNEVCLKGPKPQGFEGAVTLSYNADEYGFLGYVYVPTIDQLVALILYQNEYYLMRRRL